MPSRNALACAIVFMVLMCGSAWADDRQAAMKAAQSIMTSLSEGRYKQLWDTQTSQFFKDKMTEESFLANMSIGRAQLGRTTGSNIVDIQYAQEDPLSGHRGSIYSMTFLNSYGIGRFYERVVVLKESDGVYRMAGIWGAPAPAQ